MSGHLQVVVGFCDPCTLESNPGWPLRNFLALIAKQWCVSFIHLHTCFVNATFHLQELKCVPVKCVVLQGQN